MVCFFGFFEVLLKRIFIKCCLFNLVINGCKYGNCVEIVGEIRNNWLIVMVDDDGLGILED